MSRCWNIMNNCEVNEIICRGQLKRNFDDDDDSDDPKTAILKLNWWRNFIMFVMSTLVRKYPYLHKMDNLCVDFKQKTVKYEQDQKRFNILRTRSGEVGKYILDEEALKKLSEIIARKQQQEEGVNEKVASLETQVKKLKLTIRSQHEELKQLIQECLMKKS